VNTDRFVQGRLTPLRDHARPHRTELRDHLAGTGDDDRMVSLIVE
jgi:hypothetical protein